MGSLAYAGWLSAAMKRVSGKEMCKVLEGLGWVLDRIRGSHHIYRHPDGRSVPVLSTATGP